MVFGINIQRLAVESTEEQIIGEVEAVRSGRKGRN
jgi:hypothetical protein